MTESFPHPAGQTGEAAGFALVEVPNQFTYGAVDPSQPTHNALPDDQSPAYVSKMHMHSQETPQAVIEYERSLIAAELDISDASKLDDIVFDDEGWDSRVYLVHGGETVYKFPRSPDVVQGYAREIATLKMLASIDSDVSTQRFQAIDPGNRYFSYKGLVGTQLSELLGSLKDDEKHRIGQTIGLFLKDLHTMQLEGAPVVTVHDEIEEYQAKYRLALSVIEAHFSSEEQAVIAEFFFDVMPAEMQRLGGEIRLCHGDLGSYNIIVDAAGRPGIMDFGNIGYYDQSKDFIDFGDDTVLEAVLKAYGDTPALRAKTAIRTLALPAIDLVYYMNKKDAHGIETVIAKLRSSLLSPPNYKEHE